MSRPARPCRGRIWSISATSPAARWSARQKSDVQYLRIYIRALRQKIEADPERPRQITTEQGVGYRLRAPD